MFKNIVKILIFFTVGMAGGIFADQIFWPYFVERPLLYQYKIDKPPVYVTEIKEITIQENTALKNAVTKVENTVVGIRTILWKTKTEKTNLEGSGLIITSDGLMITAASLVPQGATFSFFVDGKVTPFQILKRDLEKNLALVKIEKNSLPTSSFADLSKLKLGERVFLVGIVFTDNGIEKIVNEGVARSISKDTVKTSIYEEKTALGSPLFDIEGNIIGLNMIEKDGRVTAVPISIIKEFAGL